MIEIYCDGFSSPHKKNMAGYAIAIREKTGIHGYMKFLPSHTTNNEAEYTAIKEARNIVFSFYRNVPYIIYSDSKVAISWVKNDENRKSHIKWIPREQNLAGKLIEQWRKKNVKAEQTKNV